MERKIIKHIIINLEKALWFTFGIDITKHYHIECDSVNIGVDNSYWCTFNILYKKRFGSAYITTRLVNFDRDQEIFNRRYFKNKKL